MRALVALLLLSAALAGCSGGGTVTVTQTASPVTQTKTTTVTAIVTATPTEDETVTSTPITSSSSSATATSTSTQAPGVQPTIENVSRSALTDTTVTIRWNVTTGGDDVSSKVEYGPSGYSLNTAAQNGTGDKSVTIANLASCTDYAARVLALGGGFQVRSEAVNFRTTGASPTIGSVAVSNVLHNKFTVSWTVSGAADSVSLVEYGGTLSYGLTTPGQAGAGAHSVVISGLTQNTDYNLRVKVMSACGSSNSANAAQTTSTLQHIDIASSGLTGYSLSPSSITVSASKSYVFEVKNTDTVAHSFSIVSQPYTTTSPIAPGGTYLFPSSIVLPAGDYTMKDHTAGGGPISTNIHSA